MYKKSFLVFTVFLVALVLQSCNVFSGYDSARKAIIAGTTAYLNLDYTKDPQTWLKKVCEVSTSKGCDNIKDAINRNEWDNVLKYKVQTSFEAKEAEPYYRIRDGWEIWKVTGNYNGFDETVYVLVVHENSQWKFDHVVQEDEKAIIDLMKKTKTLH